jgi:hypothetical protein
MNADYEALRRRAVDVRSEAAELRLIIEQTRYETRRRRHECLLSCARASAILAQPMHSPWSDLPWRRGIDELDQVLVPLP